MKISFLNKKSKQFEDFNAKEWKNVNKDRGTDNVDWDEKKIILQVMENNEIIGTLSGKIEAGVAYVGNIIVKKEKRHQGIGKKLMFEAEKIAKKSGAHKIYLMTGEKWETVKFYKSLNYQITAKVPNHYAGIDYVEMTKNLN